MTFRAVFKDILEPRRAELSTTLYFLQEHYGKVAYKQGTKPSAEKHKLEILDSTKIQELVKRLSNGNKVAQDVIEAQIASILDEIGFKMSLNVIRFLGVVLTKIVLRTCTAIYVNEPKLLKIKDGMGDTPLILVPSHRSYGDFVLMSYLLYMYDVAIPTTAAGMDFHGMKGIGEMLRNTGAFFMRRTYGQDQLYWEVFRQYVHQLVTKNDAPIQFFVEGTRSRTNKSLPPKFGLLFMTLKPLFTAEVPDLKFVPINVTYDRILEERLFAFELLGVPKPKESTSAFFKSLKIINDNYGKVYINFGEPVSAKTWFSSKVDTSSHNLKPLHSQELSVQEKQKISEFALEVINKQQKLCIVTTFNLIALTLNDFLIRNEELSIGKLLREVTWYKTVLETIGASTDAHNLPKDIFDALAVHSKLVDINMEQKVGLVCDKIKLDTFNKTQLKGHDLSEETMSYAVPYVMLQLYINPVLHYLINLMIFVKILSAGREGINRDEFLRDFYFLRSLFSYEFVICEHLLDMELQENLKHSFELQILSTKNSLFCLGTNEKLIAVLNNLLEPFLFSYSVVISELLKFRNEKLQEKVVLAKAQAEIERCWNNSNTFVHPYSLSLDSFKNCISTLISKEGLIKEVATTGTVYTVNVDILRDIQQRLGSFGKDYSTEQAVQLKNKL